MTSPPTATTGVGGWRTLLPRDADRRANVGALFGCAAAVLVCRFVLPAGAPNGVLLEGVVIGARQALLAAGVILIFRSTRILNFAQGVLGAVAATVMFNLTAIGIEGLGTVPFAVSFVVALIVATVLGLLTELTFVRRFFNSPRLVLTVVTIVMAPTLSGVNAKIGSLPFWRKGDSVRQLAESGEFPSPWPSFRFDVYPFRFGFIEVLTLAITVLVFAALALFLRRSRLGAAVRGTSENSDRALLLGINVKLLSTMVWGIAGLLSGLAAALALADGGRNAVAGAPSAILPALAAVVIGRLRSLPVTVASALTIGLIEQGLAWSFPQFRVFPIVLLGVILGGLMLQRDAYSRVDQVATGWKATEEIRPTPKPLLDVPGVRRLRVALGVIVAVLVVVFPQAYSTSQAKTASLIAVYAIIALSLVTLTGWGGQVSLGQFALVGVAAVVGAQLTGGIGLPFWIAVPVGAVFTGAFAAAIGVPALRVRGPFLAVATLAFADAVEELLGSEFVAGLIPSEINRPSFLFVSFTSERAYYYLCVTVAVLAAMIVRRLRAGRPGRVLIAIREDEYGVQPFGIAAARTRLAVFALAGSLAGTAGVLYVHLQREFDVSKFTPEVSIDTFVMAMVGGVTSVSGALLGAAYIGLTQFVIADEQIRRLSQSAGLLALLLIAPGGLSQVLYGARDSVLRLVALRRRLVVPSLFADIDPEVILNKLQTFAPPSDTRGLAAVPRDRRYAAASDLYPSAGNGRREPVKEGSR